LIYLALPLSGHRQSEKATVEYLEEQGAFIIPSSGVFSRASNEYRTIFDVALNKQAQANCGISVAFMGKF
jgi:chromosome partitioning protein